MFDSHSCLLVTGGTGFLGGAVVAELATRDIWPQVRLLVRAGSKEEGVARMRATLAKFEVLAADIARVTPGQIILGDLGAPDAIFADPAITSVTHVINSAALATFSTNPQLWPINVEGTFKFAKRLAETARLERFVHVGTAMCVGPDATPPVAEDYVPVDPIPHLVPYTETKIEIERKLRRELPQLPLIQARPTIIVGHSRLGTRPSGSIFWVFRTAVLLERWTVSLEDRIDVVPVDWAARTLIGLALKPELRHHLYHLSAGPMHASTFAELDAAIARGRNTQPICASYRKATLEELAAMSGEYNARLGPCHPRIMQRAIRLYGTFAALGMTFCNDNLIDEGFEAPPPFAAYADICAATSEGLTIADQMMADFK
jgi:nucleoside-diphosphate-sugar epimerase